MRIRGLILAPGRYGSQLSDRKEPHTHARCAHSMDGASTGAILIQIGTL